MSERLFAELPAAEKALWHSHVHEIKSGQLIAPNVPEVAEHALMQKLMYGKTFHTWHTDMDKEVPLGVPPMMGLLPMVSFGIDEPAAVFPMAH